MTTPKKSQDSILCPIGTRKLDNSNCRLGPDKLAESPSKQDRAPVEPCKDGRLIQRFCSDGCGRCFVVICGGRDERVIKLARPCQALEGLVGWRFNPRIDDVGSDGARSGAGRRKVPRLGVAALSTSMIGLVKQHKVGSARHLRLDPHMNAHLPHRRRCGGFDRGRRSEVRAEESDGCEAGVVLRRGDETERGQDEVGADEGE